MMNVGIEQKQLDLNDPKDLAIKNEITDLSSGCFIIFISIGEFLGPIFATQLLTYFSWANSNKVI